MRTVWNFLRLRYALLIVVGTFVWALGSIILRTPEKGTGDEIVLSIAHWQLESGVRDAFDELARDYQKLHPNVRIVQNAVPETTYGQWVSAQLMGGTAPDIVEIGLGLPNNIWISYLNRYFLPLSEDIANPNPHNQGTELEGVPLRLTITDGMRASYVPEMREYMSMPLSTFGCRIFYNKTLLKKLTGLDTMPANYQAFKKACEIIQSQMYGKGKHYIPIASSKYHFPNWEAYLFDLVTFPLIEKIDYNRDGFVSNTELYVAVKTGKIDFTTPELRARFQMIREITNFFQRGWTGLGRDEAVFLFAQQRSVFILSGTWDAMSLISQAEGRFDIGVMDFPIPTQDDPQYGRFVAGPLYESPQVGFKFGVTNTSKHPDVAKDFLFFLASRKANEKFNQIVGWIPGTKNAAIHPMLQAFQPHMDGVQAGFSTGTVNLGGETWIKWMQDYSLFQVGQTDYNNLVASFQPFYIRRGLLDFMEQQKDWRRGLIKSEREIVQIRAKALWGLDKTAPDDGAWILYANQNATVQIMPEIERARNLHEVRDGASIEAYGPYEYSPGVLEKVRSRLAKK